MQQRCNNSVGRSSHPAWVSGTPESVLCVQVKRVAPSAKMSNDRTMHMQGPFRRARGTAGEVQQGGVFCAGVDGGEGVGCLSHQLTQIQGLGFVGQSTLLGDKQHMAQAGHLLAQLFDLALV